LAGLSGLPTKNIASSRTVWDVSEDRCVTQGPASASPFLEGEVLSHQPKDMLHAGQQQLRFPRVMSVRAQLVEQRLLPQDARFCLRDMAPRLLQGCFQRHPLTLQRFRRRGTRPIYVKRCARMAGPPRQAHGRAMRHVYRACRSGFTVLMALSVRGATPRRVPSSSRTRRANLNSCESSHA